MSKRDTRFNREIERLKEEIKESGRLIENLDQRNDYLVQEKIALMERDDYRKFKIEQLETLLKIKEERIKSQQETIDRMRNTWKMQNRLVVGAYIVFIVLMCIAIA